jgi:hypothetical protein
MLPADAIGMLNVTNEIDTSGEARGGFTERKIPPTKSPDFGAGKQLRPDAALCGRDQRATKIRY